jgi:hypothetical protein
MTKRSWEAFARTSRNPARLARRRARSKWRRAAGILPRWRIILPYDKYARPYDVPVLVLPRKADRPLQPDFGPRVIGQSRALPERLRGHTRRCHGRRIRCGLIELSSRTRVRTAVGPAGDAGTRDANRSRISLRRLIQNIHEVGECALDHGRWRCFQHLSHPAAGRILRKHFRTLLQRRVDPGCHGAKGSPDQRAKCPSDLLENRLCPRAR